MTQRIKIGPAMNSSSTVSAELGLRLIAPPQTTTPLTGSLHYSRHDPYAVRVTFRAGLEQPVEWTFARDLLSRGIHGPQGIGNVQVWPSPGPGDGDPSVLTIELTSPHGQVRVETPAGQVTDFLRRACQIVPDGQESSHLDLDDELNDLLRHGS
jgi:sporulation and cell division protein SsgA